MRLGGRGRSNLDSGLLASNLLELLDLEEAVAQRGLVQHVERLSHIERRYLCRRVCEIRGLWLGTTLIIFFMFFFFFLDDERPGTDQLDTNRSNTYFKTGAKRHRSSTTRNARRGDLGFGVTSASHMDSTALPKSATQQTAELLPAPHSVQTAPQIVCSPF